MGPIDISAMALLAVMADLDRLSPWRKCSKGSALLLVRGVGLAPSPLGSPFASVLGLVLYLFSCLKDLGRGALHAAIV